MSAAIATGISVTAVLSMLHEPVDRPNSATRLFRGSPVLSWTLDRLARCRGVGSIAVLCWDDQLAAVEPLAAEREVHCSVRSPRIGVPRMDAISAARRWADGWRGGLVNACAFDRGFHAAWIAEILQKLRANTGLLVDPAAGLVDPMLIDGLIDHAAGHDEIQFFFSQAAPGLSGVLLRKTLLEQLAVSRMHPGRLLAYCPDLPQRDPISAISCASIPAALARTSERLTLDCDEQIDRVSGATEHLNGELVSTRAEHLLRCVSAAPRVAALPRELVLELNTQRISRPIYWPGAHIDIRRGDLSLEMANIILQEFAQRDNARLILGGVGDPLLHEHIFAIIDLASRLKISAVALETDLLRDDLAVIDALADAPIDVVSVHLSAWSASTYLAVMGVDGLRTAVRNLGRLIDRRQASGRGTPLIVPTFVKTSANLSEMEIWYDHWLRTLGCAVIQGPTDYASQIPDTSAAQMEPPRRQPCVRLNHRMTILSDGSIVSCEQDIMGQRILGHAGIETIQRMWQASLGDLRQRHAAEKFDQCGLCGNCRDWHRP